MSNAKQLDIAREQGAMDAAEGKDADPKRYRYRAADKCAAYHDGYTKQAREMEAASEDGVDNAGLKRIADVMRQSISDGGITLRDIEIGCEDYRLRRDKLEEELAQLQARIEAEKRAHLPILRRLVISTTDARDKLAAMIESARGLFDSPRSRTYSGIKAGLQKGKAKLHCADKGRTVELIREEMPAMAPQLIRKREEPILTAMDTLSDEQLRRIGVTRQDPGDQVIIKQMDSDLDKLVDSLIGAELEEEVEP